jgi:hypothetical protein
MRPEITGEFEIHLTARPDADLARIAARHALKTTYIELDRGEHPRQPMLTYHASGPESEVVGEAHRVADRLAADGLPVVRIKVEAHAANPGLPQTGHDDPGGYFEGHLRVVVGAGRLAELRELAVRHGAHLSQSPAKMSGLERRFVTARAHSVGAPEARRRFDRVQDAIEAAGFSIDKIEHEYVLHDTHYDLDRGWLPAAARELPGAVQGRPSPEDLSARHATMPA